MDDRDTTKLERAIRRLAEDNRPSAPRGIHDLIDETAAGAPKRRPLAFAAAAGPWRRHSLALAGVAAALAIALAATGVVMSVRQSQVTPAPSSPVAVGSASAATNTTPGSAKPSATAAEATGLIDPMTGSLAWTAVDAPAPAMVARVANGYIGECTSNGQPAVCTSPDGIVWSLPLDPSIFQLDGGGTFGGWSVAHADAGWVATGTVDPGAWFSADGLHWSKVDLGVQGLGAAHVQAFADGFAVGAVSSITGDVVLRSSDGRSWHEVSPPAGISGVQLGGAIGLLASRIVGGVADQPPKPLVSADGVTWKDLVLPPSVSGVGSAVRLPSGGYLGAPWGSNVKGLLASPDGITWTASAALGAQVLSLANLGSVVAAVASAPGSEAIYLWVTRDGENWHRLDNMLGLAAAPMIGSLDGRRIALFDSSRLIAVGSFVAEAASPTPALPVSTPTPGPTAAPIEAGGFRWHATNIVPTQGVVVRTSNGYIANCRGQMCSSRDGWDWSMPADPNVFRADGDAVFTPAFYYHVKNGPYAISTQSNIWYSADGVSWHLAQTPPAANLIAALFGSDAGFTILVPTDNGFGGDCPAYTSTDGATWTAHGKVACIWQEMGGDPAVTGGLLGQGPGIKTKGPIRYSADGITWVTASVPGVPAEAIEGTSPYRLADGTLVARGPTGPVRSADGRKWERMPGFTSTASWPVSQVVAGSGMVLIKTDDGTGGRVLALGPGDTFIPILVGVESLEPWGDLSSVRSGGVTYIGEPIGPVAAVSPVPLSGPIVTPAPTPTPPPGGISQDEAIRIAVDALHVNATLAATARATATNSDRNSGRWVWSVSFRTDDQRGLFVDIDYFTGEVVSKGDWIA